MTITIDKGVPMPDGPGLASRSRYPWALMEIGDSFLVPINGRPLRAVRQSIRGNMSLQHKRTSHRYACRTVVENGERVVRVWRVA
jgi:hypothetical protein